MENQLTTSESLRIITSMINQSKSNVQQSSFYFLLWGWVATLAFGAHYALMVYGSFRQPYLVWLICIPAGILSGIYGAKMGTRATVRTHLDYIYAQTWLGFLPPLLMVIYFGHVLGFQNITGLILMLAGSAVFISSRLLKFTPSLLGSIVMWSLAVLSLVYNDERQYLFGALATFLGYLVPGYILKRREQNA